MSPRTLPISPRTFLDHLLRTAVYLAPGLVLLVAFSRHQDQSGPVFSARKDGRRFEVPSRPRTLNFSAWDYYDP